MGKSKLLATRFLLNRSLSWLSKASDERLIRLTKILEYGAARTEHHKVQLRQLRQLFEQKHPAIQLARRFFSELNPIYRSRIVTNLGINATWKGDQIRKEFAKKEGIYPPYLIVISPTMRCNLKCVGCYAGEYPRGKDPLSFEALDRIVTEAKQMGSYFITISGGEPFVRPDLLDLYEKHDDAVFLIYTNGTLINDRVVSRLAEMGNVAPAISLEGFQKETDARRGDGVYEKVMAAMDRLREAGCFFGFSATATRQNADVYFQDDFYDHMIEKGCLFGWFFIFVPVGKDSTTDLMVTPEQRDKLREVTSGIRRRKPIFVADFWNDGCLTDGCMSGGSLYLHVNYRGDLEPCVFMHFAKDNILDMYDQGQHLWDVLNTPLFSAIRAVNRKDPNRLRPCPIIDHNEWLEEALRKVDAQPTHEGAEDIIGRLKEDVRQWSAAYAPYAEKAWASPEYQWFHKDKGAGVIADNQAQQAPPD